MILEKELKLLLDENDYYEILNSFGEVSEPLKQVNYYFDTKDFYLNEYGITLRIRKEEGRNLLCLKKKIKGYFSEVTTSEEFERGISNNEFLEYQKSPECIIENFVDNLPGNIKQKLMGNKLTLLGSIKNERRKIRFNNYYLCDLDYTEYPNGKTYYEMEFEDMNSESDINAIINYLNKKNIKYNINSKSKYKRFVECINN